MGTCAQQKHKKKKDQAEELDTAEKIQQRLADLEIEIRFANQEKVSLIEKGQNLQAKTYEFKLNRLNQEQKQLMNLQSKIEKNSERVNVAKIGREGAKIDCQGVVKTNEYLEQQLVILDDQIEAELEHRDIKEQISGKQEEIKKLNDVGKKAEEQEKQQNQEQNKNLSNLTYQQNQEQYIYLPNQTYQQNQEPSKYLPNLTYQQNQEPNKYLQNLTYPNLNQLQFISLPNNQMESQKQQYSAIAAY